MAVATIEMLMVAVTMSFIGPMTILYNTIHDAAATPGAS